MNKLFLTVSMLAFVCTRLQAGPAVTWAIYNSSGQRSGSLPVQFVMSGNYQVQASGYSDVGQLVNVIVWMDGVPLAWDGGGDHYSNRTDPNWITYTGNGTVHLFSAQAVSYDGQAFFYSPVIYWLVKETSSTGSFTFNDLVGIRSQNRDKNPLVTNNTINAWMPNMGDPLANTYILNGVISSLANDHQNKALEFSPEVYLFDDRTPLNAAQLPGTGGYMCGFQNVASFLMVGTPGSTVLTWAVRDPYRNEEVIQPSGSGLTTPPNTIPTGGYYDTLFIYNYNGDRMNPYVADDTNHSGQSPSGIQPHHFLFFDENCASVVISGISFWSDYNWRIGPDGSHIKMNGSHQRITNCEFHNAPGYSVSVGSGGSADFVNVDSSRFFFTHADGLHAGDLSNTGADLSNPNSLSYFTGNTFYDTGDDAISIAADVNGLVVQYNAIEKTHKRGLFLWSGAQNVVMQYNTVSGTNGAGIEVGVEGSGNSSSIKLLSNYVENVGVWNSPSDAPAPNQGYGYRLSRINSLTANFAPLNQSDIFPHSVNLTTWNVNSTGVTGWGCGAFLDYVNGTIQNSGAFDGSVQNGAFVVGSGCSLSYP